MNWPRISWILGMLWIGALAGWSQEIALKPQQPEGSHVRASLIADRSALEPGRPLRLGVRFVMDPGWHIYWQFSGDAGLPTRIRWKLPEGFTAGPLQWPTPQRFNDSGLVTFGYAAEVILFVNIGVPTDIKSGSYEFGAEADWLVCKESCVPGEKALNLTLPVGSGGSSADAPRLEAAATQVPTSQTQQIQVRTEPESVLVRPGQTASVSLTVAPASGFQLVPPPRTEPRAGVFPILPESFEITLPEWATTTPRQNEVRWVLQPRPQAKPGETSVTAVLALEVQSATGQREWVRQLVPIPVRIENGAATVGGTPSASKSQVQGPQRANHSRLSLNDSSIRPPEGFSFLKKNASLSGGLWKFLVFAFFGGLLLNIMPCVLPVLSLKLLSLVRQADQSRRRILLLAGAYAAGVLVSFAVLAAIVIGVKAAAGQVGWGFQFQEPRFVIVTAAIIFAFGLSLFGVFAVELSGMTMTKLDALGRREGLSGSFLNGVLATALATPCTAPFLSEAIGFAFTRPAPVILVFFLMIGLGLAIPFVALAAVPAWRRWVPKPGPWMERFKQAMGFLLMGTVVWLLWVLSHQLGGEGVVRTVGFLLVVAFAAWLVGWASDPRYRAGRRRALKTAALLLVLAGFWIPERFVSRWDASAVTPASSLPTTTQAEGIRWEPFSIERVEGWVGEGRTVFLDFTASWCTTCLANEKTVLASRRVAEAFARYGVVPVRADWTRRDAEIGAVLAQFGRSGVPTYVILPAGRPGEPIVLPTVLTPGAIEEALTKAAKTVSRGVKQS